MGEKAENTLVGVAGILFFGLGILQIGAGWAGIEDAFGWGWSVAAAVSAIWFRFTLPLAVGAFLCAKNIWGLHWVLALLFAAPALLFMVPAFLAALMETVRR